MKEMIFEHGMCGNNPLYFVETEDDVIQLIEKYGTSSVNMFGDTALHYSSSGDICRLLIENGADVNAKNKTGFSALSYSTSEEVSLELILNGADIESRSSKGFTPLHMAMGFETAKILIEYGADVTTKNDLGETPLHLAPNPPIIDLLVENGADINAKRLNGDSALSTQAYYMSVNIFGSDRNIKRLIELGASIDSKNNAGLGIKEIMGDMYPFVEKVQCERARIELIVLRNLYKMKNHGWDEENICNRVITHHSDDIFSRIVGFV